MQEWNLIIWSNGQFFKFHPIPYFSKSIMEFSLSIYSKFNLFYLCFNYLIELFFIHVNLNKNVSKFAGSWFIIEFRCIKYSSIGSKTSKGLFRSNIPQAIGRWKWTAALPYQLWHSIFQRISWVENGNNLLV